MTGNELDLLKSVLDANFLNDGPLTRKFEQRIAQIVGCKYAVAVTSGTAALACALIAVGVGLGDDVIVPDLTFIATANAVRLAGANPILADVESRRFTLDPDSVERKRTGRTKAIITVDVNGRGVAYEWFEAYCREHGIALITDSAEALGSMYRDKPLGSWGLAGCFSFSPNKIVTTGQGGVITTNCESLYDRLLQVKDQGRPVRGTGGDDQHPSLGFNFKFTDVQAAIGLAQLDAMRARMAKMQRRELLYQEYLGKLSYIRLGHREESNELRLWADILSEKRDEIAAALSAAGIGYRKFWHPIHTQAPYRSDEAFPQSDHISRCGLWLPSHFDVGESEISRIAEVIRAAVR